MSRELIAVCSLFIKIINRTALDGRDVAEIRREEFFYVKVEYNISHIIIVKYI